MINRILLIAALCSAPGALPASDATLGESLYQARCGGCHSIEENGPGPRHRGLIGCVAGSQPGFAYSAALRESNIVWSRDTLDRWLADPAKMVPGTSMPLKLASDPDDRAALVDYLLTAGGGAGACTPARN